MSKKTGSMLIAAAVTAVALLSAMASIAASGKVDDLAYSAFTLSTCDGC